MPQSAARLTLIATPSYILGRLDIWRLGSITTCILVSAMISVVVPVHNAPASLERCLRALTDSDYTDFEIIVVDDCSTDDSAAVARRFPLRLVSLKGKPFGPAYARNRGAEAAAGDIVCFVDSDVLVHKDTMRIIAQTFVLHPDYAAVFGSYDQNPGEGDFLSQYKNLVHHFVHQQAKADASTFWSGCGAMRRGVFHEMRGFDAGKYPRPSIEDIDLGCRLTKAGYKIYVNKEVQVTHLKRWTLLGWVKTDVLDRAIPWTRLIMRQGHLPNDLNLTTGQRLCALLVVAILAVVVFCVPPLPLISLAALTALTILLLSRWQLTEGPMFTTARAGFVISALILILATGALSVIGRTYALLFPLIFISLLYLAGIAGFKPNGAARTFCFAVLNLASAAGLGILLFTAPWAAATAILGMLLIIAHFNFPLLAFFARCRNIWFAMATLPFHLMYYIYSMAAFAIGASLHFLDAKTKP
jgi:GT2 family glycosyltransferase